MVASACNLFILCAFAYPETRGDLPRGLGGSLRDGRVDRGDGRVVGALEAPDPELVVAQPRLRVLLFFSRAFFFLDSV